ncbi:flavodoxin [Idiomarina tyrosinivorans]|uniref:Flavodoxin n=1 Tax=Idiomarina tyrosinivorans TaxID=1445662 RepID=A0A432ZSU4_9GAMM|nr:flavodoxin domain-containing protein [Idiomarina tyrosinivorans]RUO80980.1 flavodoxin [Idiomarina tyrosinivorans]
MAETIHILIGTTSGNTEYLADQLSEALHQQGFATQLHDEPDLGTLPTEGTWLVCLASHGAGDYADSMLGFYDQISLHEDPLKQLKYAVIAIGESCYDTYCKAGRHLDSRLQELGGKRLTSRLEIDMLEDDPEQKALQWLPNMVNALNSEE